MLKGVSGALISGGSAGTFTSLTATGLFTQAGEDSITAFATGGQTSATALSASKNAHRISVCATAGDSVKLPAATVSQWHYIRNDGAATCQVFGQATETINGIASATGVPQLPGTGALYVCTTAGAWTKETGTNSVYTPPAIGAISAIPFIYISSGSIAAGGGISGITSLVLTYASAYVWFPANAVATVASAGWYYCTFSSATAGTAFLNTYTSGTPAIPSSPTAVTDGKGAFTSDTATHVGPSITLPGGAMGANGQLRLKQLVSYNNTAGTKTLDMTYGGSTLIAANVQTTSLYNQTETTITNRGANNVQVVNTFNMNGAAAVGATAPAQLAIDTTAAVTLALRLTKNTATDNVILERYLVEFMYSP